MKGVVTTVLLAALAALLPARAAEESAGHRFDVRFSEIMYQPKDGDAFEFLELFNAGNAGLDLSGWSVDGLKFVFPANASLAAGALGVLISDANPQAFSNRFPAAPILGVYTGRLSNQGERIAIEDTAKRTVISVTYSPGGFWPSSAAGHGGSLEFTGGDGEPNDPFLWTPSKTEGGTPGVASPKSSPPVVHIFKLVARSAVPGGGDMVELINTGSARADLSSWSLSDSPSLPNRYPLPLGTTLEPGGKLVVRFDTATNSPGLHTGFGLDAEGGVLSLSDARGTRVDGLLYGPQAEGYALLRQGEGWVFASESSGQILTLGRQEDLVLNEWHADRAGVLADWFELYNPGGQLAVALTGLSFSTTNGWVKNRAPSLIGPKSFVRYWADKSSQGGHADLKIPATGGELALFNAAGTLVQKIQYGAQSEGTTEGRLPDGSATITRFLDGGSPGASNLVDRDGDGMPDLWETKWSFDPAAPGDAALDADSDGLTNLQEYLGGTDPRDASSVLRLTSVLNAKGDLELSFLALAGQGYSLLFRTNPESGSWSKHSDLAPAPSNSLIKVLVPAASGATRANFFKVTTPQIFLPGESVLASTTPASGDREASVAAGLVLRFRLPVDPANFNAKAFSVTDDLGTAVPGELRFSENFQVVEFRPALPWLNATGYRAVLAEGLRLLDGKPLGVERTVSFGMASAPPLVEDRNVYAQDSTGLTRADFKLTPMPGGYTLDDVNRDDDANDTYNPVADGIWSEGVFGAGATQSNATIEQRGQSTRSTGQKSYKVRLAKNGPAWRGLRVINLNKHPYDLSRVRNKLAMDLFSSMPDMTSLRTFFLKLKVDGTSYGLFTVVEDPHPDFLAAHGLDFTGHLYKAREFDFSRNSEVIRNEHDPLYRTATFQSALEIKGAASHAKLIRMLEAVNNEEGPIERVLEQHFHLGNYLCWLASNILMENLDTITQNFLLYSPSSGSCWYFLPWDYDGGFGFYEQPDQMAGAGRRARWTEGVANWWAVSLHRRVLKSPALRSRLTDAVKKLAAESLSRPKIKALLDRYRDTVASEVFLDPDQQELPVGMVSESQKRTEWETEFRRLETVVQARLTEYLNTLGRPMPFFQSNPIRVAEGWRFQWDASYHFEGAAMTYDFELSTSPAFAQAAIVARRTGLEETELILPQALKPGAYYYRVFARTKRNPAMEWQIAFDSYTTPDGTKTYHGVIRFESPAGAAR